MKSLPLILLAPSEDKAPGASSWTISSRRQ